MLNKLLIGAGVAGGRMVYRGFNRYTANAAATQKKLLTDLLKKNAATEYGKLHDFRSIRSIEEYQARVPLGDYSTFEPYIRRMLNGEAGLLTHSAIRQYASTSGSSGAPKLVPVSARAMWNIHCMGFVAPEACVADYYRRNGKKLSRGKGLLTWSIKNERLPNGNRLCFGTGIPITNMRAFLNGYAVTPRALVFNETPERSDCRYLILRLGLQYENLSFIGSAVISSVYSLFQYLEKNWRSLCDDIETGAVSAVVDPTLKKKLAGRLKKDPARAAALRREFVCGFDSPIAPRIWKELCWVYGMCGGSLQSSAENLRRYVGDIPIHTFGYGAAEGYFAMPLTPDSNEAALLPKSNFYEFIPLDAPEGAAPKRLDEVETGKKYEIVITNLSGLYRYRIGDVVQVTGFHNGSPKIRFLYRANIVLNISDEKTTQEMLDAAMTDAAQTLGIMVHGYSVCAETDRGLPHYTVFIETPSPFQPHAPEAFDKAMSKYNVIYDACLRYEYIAPAQVCYLQPGTYDEYKETLRGQGKSIDQLKPVTILTNDDAKRFFYARAGL